MMTEVWTDGGVVLGEDPLAGYGAVVCQDGREQELGGSLPLPVDGKLSSAYVELLAVLRALATVGDAQEVVYCDNQIVRQWMRRKWRCKAVACRPILRELRTLVERKRLRVLVRAVNGAQVGTHRRAHVLASLGMEGG